jgi:hypothetical protein
MQVFSKTVVDTIAMFATDRGVTGQEGVSVIRDAEAADEFPTALAAEIFAADDDIDHVFVASNQVVVRRGGGWNDGLLDTVAAVITGFFVFYDEA